ncbi:MAG: FN3 associated domain-containing protein [Clostridia bacterium]
MKKNYNWRSIIAIIVALAFSFTMVSCSGASGSGDAEYETQTITFEGLINDGITDVSLTETTVAELRKLPQHELNASYKRTTGMTEEFKMSGPYLSEVIEYLGGNIDDYAGIGIMGKDGYYCLISKEIIETTPDLLLALVIDGETKLDEDNAPARLAVQGQFGPYWVKCIEKIMLYTEIPEKDITSVWVFDNLAKGIEPYEYEYYGSKDKAIDLEQIFQRLDYVDSKAFFTMKSSDGFKKNEVINMVKSRYYIKVEGKDAPTNVSPYIKLGMNVQNIAWISTNADAAIFPGQMMKYMDNVEIDGQKGITLEEVLYETGRDSVKNQAFDLLGTSGEKITIEGEDMNQGILIPHEDGSASVVWKTELGYENIKNLLRIRLVETNKASADASKTTTVKAIEEKVISKAAKVGETLKKDTILTITGDGVSKNLYFSLNDLKNMQDGYLEQCYSSVNNYPTKKFNVAKGVSISYLMEESNIKKEAKSITVEASDGYKAVFTQDQLLGKRYRFPEVISGSAANPVLVQSVLAWAFGDGQDFSNTKEDDLRIVIGQQGINDVNTVSSVRMVSKITISTKNTGTWANPSASISEGNLIISHESFDQVKLYYTLNGSEPTVTSQVYNPSTTYFQPDLIKPIPINGSGILKVKAVGYGKEDSEVLTFAY